MTSTTFSFDWRLKIDQIVFSRTLKQADWPDTRILRSNGLQVVTSQSYDSLFRMLGAPAALRSDPVTPGERGVVVVHHDRATRDGSTPVAVDARVRVKR